MRESFRHRFRPTEITFGPLGRVVATLVVLWVVWLFLSLGIYGLVGLAILIAGGILPNALRDIWRRVPEPGEGAFLDVPRPELPEDYVPITEREGPKRW